MIRTFPLDRSLNNVEIEAGVIDGNRQQLEAILAKGINMLHISDPSRPQL